MDFSCSWSIDFTRKHVMDEDEFIDLLKDFVKNLPVEFDQHADLNEEGKIWISFELEDKDGY